MRAAIAVCLSAILLGGCSTYAANRYTPSTDNVVTLRDMEIKPIDVGQIEYDAEKPNELMCRAVGPIQTPDKESFGEFVRGALVDELRMAEKYDENSDVRLSGELREFTFSSNQGYWSIRLYLESNNSQSMEVAERYEYTTSFYGETACNQTAQAMMPAVQDLVNRIVTSPEFRELAQ